MPEPTDYEIEQMIKTSRDPVILWLRFTLWLRYSMRSQLELKLAKFASRFCRGRARAWGRRLARPGAILIDDQGPGRTDGNWIGAVRLGRRGEEWPRGRDGRPMTPVVQMNVAESPHVPESLKDVRILTLYVSAPDDEYDTIYLPDWHVDEPAHGDGWCLRTYGANDDLIEASPPAGTRLPHPKAMRWEVVVSDTPNSLADACDASYPTRFAYDGKQHRGGTKLGGWPTFIQGGWPWRPWTSVPDAPLYVLQVCGGDGFDWGDAGAASLGVTPDGQWKIIWQSH